jgi:predicted nucleic acid-binding Zn ribbon protein
MKNNNTHSLKSVIMQLLKAYRWEDKLDSVDLANSWEKVVGGIFAKHTTNLYVKNRVLYVSLDSSVLRNELHMARSKIVTMINEEVGKDLIDEIVLR